MSEEKHKKVSVNKIPDVVFLPKPIFGIGGVLALNRRPPPHNLIGKTGMGKTTLMEQMVLSDIYNGNGRLGRSHGDFAEDFGIYSAASH